MKYQKVIFIDPGTKWGWATWQDPFAGTGLIRNYRPSEKEFSSGALSASTEPGPRVIGFWNELEFRFVTTTMERIQRRLSLSTILAWEEAAFCGHSKADRMYGTWEGLLILFCEVHKIPYMTLNQSTIKAYARKQGFYEKKSEIVVASPKKTKKGFYVKKPKSKPSPRPEWKLNSASKLQEHEIDARWGLECLLEKLKEEEDFHISETLGTPPRDAYVSDGVRRIEMPIGDGDRVEITPERLEPGAEVTQPLQATVRRLRRDRNQN